MLNVADRSGNGKGVGFVGRVNMRDELTDTGASDTARVHGEFNASLAGPFVATLRLERSYDGGATWGVLTALGTDMEFTDECEEIFNEPEHGVLYRWNCVAYTSGAIKCRISQ